MHVVYAAGAVFMLLYGIVTIFRAIDLGRENDQSPA